MAQRQTKSRLDYFFLSEYCLNIATNIDILPTLHSGHILLRCFITNNSNHKTGRGLWKCNTTPLYDEDLCENY